MSRVILYALADYSLPEHQTVETFSTREEAEAALRGVPADAVLAELALGAARTVERDLRQLVVGEVRLPAFTRLPASRPRRTRRTEG